MAINNMRDALVTELKDLLSAERQITKALPKMAEKAQHPKLKEAFETHLRQTEGQIDRLEQAFAELGESARSEKCKAIAGIIEEGEELLKKKVDPEIKDAMLIAAAQKVEHYEIASYGTVRSRADDLGLDSVARLMEETLNEEKHTDDLLNQLSIEVNRNEAA